MKFISNAIDLRKPFDIEGIPLKLYALNAILSIILLLLGELINSGIAGAFAVLWTIGFFFFAIGERIRIFKTLLGGGLLLAYFGAALIASLGVFSVDEVQFLQSHLIGSKLLYLVLVTLIVSSVLSVPTVTLKNALLSFLPIILGGLVVSAIFGIIAGLLTGIPVERVVIMYYLPIMGGGTGAGAIPMSEVYADVTGANATEYFNYAIGILTLGNIVAIMVASLLRQLGQKFPSLSGEGKLARSTIIDCVEDKKDDEVPVNTLAALVLIVCIFLVSVILSSSIGLLHFFAWVTIIAIILNVAKVVSPAMQSALRKLNTWGMKAFLVTILVAFGLSADFNLLSELTSPGNLLVIVSIVLGAAVGSGIVSYFVKCYPIEGALSGGLCMANAGGSGDLQVLSAARRLELYPYAQISSRLGGAFMLLLANYLFKLLT